MEYTSLPWYVCELALRLPFSVDTLLPPQDFKKFPYDSQELRMQFSYDHGSSTSVNQFIMSAVTSQWFVRGDGDITSGWKIDSLDIPTRNESMADNVDYFISKYGLASNEDDPMSITSGNVLTKSRTIEFDVVINVSRQSLYYTTNMIIPIYLLIGVSLVTYFIPPEILVLRVNMVCFTLFIFVLNDDADQLNLEYHCVFVTDSKI